MTDKPIFHTGKPEPRLVYAREGEVAELHAKIEQLRIENDKLRADLTQAVGAQNREIERLRALGTQHAIEADARLIDLLAGRDAEIERLRKELNWISTGGDLWSRQVTLAALEPKP
jgi:predicted RNase H-like nuclease (RuvC/YqgF family)